MAQCLFCKRNLEECNGNPCPEKLSQKKPNEKADAIKALFELKNLFLEYPEEFDSRERYINNRINIIEKQLRK